MVIEVDIIITYIYRGDDKMKNIKRKNWGRFIKIIISSLVAITILSVFLGKFVDLYFSLNENQLLYLFSTIAQIIGGIFGLTLTAYVFFVDKFKESARDDSTYYDATAALLKRYFYILILIAFICGTTIFFSIVGIITLHDCDIIYPFIINESILLFLIGIIVTLTFGVMLLDPEKLEKEITALQKKAEEYYHNTSSDTRGDFRKFLKTYNKLEHLIIQFAGIFIEERNYSRNPSRPQIIQSLKLLNKDKIIDDKLLNEINELRMFRNALVHGVDFTISQNVCIRVDEIYHTLKDAYDIFEKNGINLKE